MIFNIMSTFVVGVLSSLLAAWLYDRITRRDK